jgi:hypothetical protein
MIKGRYSSIGPSASGGSIAGSTIVKETLALPAWSLLSLAVRVKVYVPGVFGTSVEEERQLVAVPDAQPGSILNRNATIVILLVLRQNLDHGGRNGKCNTNQDSMGTTSGRSAGNLYRSESWRTPVDSVSVAQRYSAARDQGLSAADRRQSEAYMEPAAVTSLMSQR